jgi:hypothetical protein
MFKLNHYLICLLTFSFFLFFLYKLIFKLYTHVYRCQDPYWLFVCLCKYMISFAITLEVHVEINCSLVLYVHEYLSICLLTFSFFLFFLYKLIFKLYTHVYKWLVPDLWFSPDTPVSSDKSDRYDIEWTVEIIKLYTWTRIKVDYLLLCLFYISATL